MISIARILGAPVMEPQGKSRRITASAPISGSRRADTVEIIWCTVS